MGLTRITSDGITDATIATADLADQSVTLAKLPHGTSSNDGKFLRANNGGDPTFETVNTDLVSDTSPQLGGNLASNGNLIKFGDSSGASDDRLTFGNGDDIQVYYTNSNLYVTQATGDIILENTGTNTSNQIYINGKANTNSIAVHGNGAVELYDQSSGSAVKRFETTSIGARVINQFFVSEGTINLEKAGVHHHRILSNDTGNDLGFQQSSDTGSNTNFTTYLRINDGGNISLPVDNQKLRLGASADLQIYHGSNNNFVQSVNNHNLILRAGSGDNYVQGSDVFIGNSGATKKYIDAHEDAAVELYYDNSLKARTQSWGWEVFGNIHGDDNIQLNLGTSNDLQIYHDGNNSFIVNTTGSLNLSPNGDAGIQINQSGSVKLAHNDTFRFETTSYGAVLIGSLNSYGHVYPNANNDVDLGTSSLRWRNVFTNDLNLSNEGGANDVDGTWGSYTIQEGAENLFLVNKRNGKKYKFNLTEVS